MRGKKNQESTGDLFEHGHFANDKDTVITVAYIKVNELLDKTKYSVYISDDYLFIVNTILQQVVMAFHNNEIVANTLLKNEADKDLVFAVHDTLAPYFSGQIDLVKDYFAIDIESKSVYIGKAALDYINDIEDAKNEERIFH